MIPRILGQTFPEIFSLCKNIFLKTIESAYHPRTDDDDDQEAKANTEPYLEVCEHGIDSSGELQIVTDLPHESLVHGIILVSECLLEERKQDRNHNARFDTFSETNEEHCAH